LEISAENVYLVNQFFMLRSLANLIFPPLCPGCDNPLADESTVICTTCRHDIPFTQHYLHPDNEVTKKFLGRIALQHASALLYFHKEGIGQNLIHNLKYRRQQQVGTLMGQWFAYNLNQVAELHDVTDVVPVPMHPKKLRERGYNQAAGFGQQLANGLNASYNDTILLRSTYNKTQTKKNKETRAEIINSAFAVNYSASDHNKHFLLVDDVITTGATLEACGKLLLQIPGARLSIVTIAYAHS
jgi:ComF family protein